jgi:SAM-dependent methyltransferase
LPPCTPKIFRLRPWTFAQGAAILIDTETAGSCKKLGMKKEENSPSMSRFTAHNIRLDDGALTLPTLGFLTAEHPWLLSAKRILTMIYPEGLQGKRIVDLGCLEGGFTVEFARMGMNALGIEVRKSNFENCLYVKEQLSLSNLSFANDDVWNVASYGSFDIVFCCGILYHLECPGQFVRQLAAICKKVIIINTHFATVSSNSRFPLGEMTMHEGMEGRWFREYDPANDTELEKYKWSAWSNYRSFWLRREYIPHLLRNAGFELAFEQFDHLGQNIAQEMIAGSYNKDDRGVFVGVKIPE